MNMLLKNSVVSDTMASKSNSPTSITVRKGVHAVSSEIFTTEVYQAWKTESKSIRIVE